MMADFGELVIATMCSDASVATGVAHLDSLNEVCTRKVMKEFEQSRSSAIRMQCQCHQSQLVSSDDEDGGGAGISKWICVRLDHGRCERQDVGLFRLEDPQRSRGEIESGSSVATGSITSFDSVRHDTVAELQGRAIGTWRGRRPWRTEVSP